ncbi:MAG: HAD-IIB family hydrolase [Candidatus Liptonbacteria bacterium]|nr:HAD-IIB family hydrolase [Candidatus Liptonbacteria bacterium]
MKSLKEKYKTKELVVFDLDGTLTESKSYLKPEMSALLVKLLKKKRVAIIGGGKYELFKKQFIARFRCPKELLKNLFLFPTTSTAFYRYKNGWKKVYRHELSKRDRARIKKAFAEVFREANYVHPEKTYGKVIEDRGTQITFSALGQEVVAMLGEREGVRLKNEWKKKNTALKLKMAKMLQKKLPDLEVHSAGYTSIDITKKGIDKAYGVRQIEKNLRTPVKKMIFVGDALYPGGNDYAAKKTGVECFQVSGPSETAKFIRFLLN